MIEELLKKLRLPRIRSIYPEYIEKANKEDMKYSDFLLALLEEETASREENRLKALLRRARFPYQKTLEQFDFRLHPELRRKVFQAYLEEGFVREGRSLVLIGAPGLGKTHLTTSIGIRMVQKGFDVRFVTVQNLVNRVLESESIKERHRVLKSYLNCDLLLLDELGYLPPEPEVGPILYELISSRYEKKATIITSNKSLTEWGGIIGDTALASALIDRLLHHGDVYYLKGESYRLKDKDKSVKQEIRGEVNEQEAEMTLCEASQ
jgi:DNA replication protein DnaC